MRYILVLLMLVVAASGCTAPTETRDNSPQQSNGEVKVEDIGNGVTRYVIEQDHVVCYETQSSTAGGSGNGLSCVPKNQISMSAEVMENERRK